MEVWNVICENSISYALTEGYRCSESNCCFKLYLQSTIIKKTEFYVRAKVKNTFKK